MELICWNEPASKTDPGFSNCIILPHLASVKDIFHFDMLYILSTQHGFSSDGEKFPVTLIDSIYKSDCTFMLILLCMFPYSKCMV